MLHVQRVRFPTLREFGYVIGHCMMIPNEHFLDLLSYGGCLPIYQSTPLSTNQLILISDICGSDCRAPQIIKKNAENAKATGLPNNPC